VDNSTGTPTVHVYATSDINAQVKGELTLTLASWAGDVDMTVASVNVQLAALESSRVLSTPLCKLLGQAPACAAAFSACFLQVSFTGASAATEHLAAQDQLEAPRSEIFPAKLREAQLQVPKLTLSSFAAGHPADSTPAASQIARRSAADTPLLSASFTLHADVPAAVVVLDTPLAGHFSANSFVLRAGENVTLSFIAESIPLQPFTLQQLQQSISVRSLRDSYSDASVQAEMDAEQEEEMKMDELAHVRMLLLRSASVVSASCDA